MSAIVPITPTEVMPAIAPEHRQASYPQIFQLCQARAYGELAQMLNHYRTFLTQEFNQGAIACSVDQHIALDASLRQLEGRAGDLAIALEQNTASLDANTTTLGYNTHQLSRLNDNLEAYLSQPQQQQTQQPIYIVNEVHARGGDGGRAIADSQSSSESETDGWGYGDPLWQWAIAVVVLLVAAVAITHSRPQPGPMRPPSAPAQQAPIDGAITL
ncbi:MAG: hypothetical protein AAGF75_04760 [Cyanobacteria bacterium P01_H01_bin.130]